MTEEEIVRMLLFCTALGIVGCVNGLEFENDTPYFLHLLHEDEMLLYVPPGGVAELEVDVSGSANIVVAGGQGFSSSISANFYCCDDRCGELTAHFENETLTYSTYDEECDGSCPYVYANDGEGFRLQGEALVGALNIGGKRTDLIELPDLKEKGGIYSVQIRTELAEIDFIDHVILKVLDHPQGTRVVTDSNSDIYLIEKQWRPTSAEDSNFQTQENHLMETDGKSWVSSRTSSLLHGKVRDYVVLGFEGTAGIDDGILVMHGRNTQFVQDKYHAYMQEFGPGLKKLMKVTSVLTFYPKMLNRLLEEVGFSIDVATKRKGAWANAGHIRPIGPAGMRTTAHIIPMDKKSADDISVRLAVLPGAWEIDSVYLGRGDPRNLVTSTVHPRRVEFVSTQGKSEPITLENVHTMDEKNQRMDMGDTLTMIFDAPPKTADTDRTAFLQVSGYYEELSSSNSMFINLAKLKESYSTTDGFGFFAYKKLILKEKLDMVTRWITEMSHQSQHKGAQ